MEKNEIKKKKIEKIKKGRHETKNKINRDEKNIYVRRGEKMRKDEEEKEMGRGSILKTGD